MSEPASLSSCGAPALPADGRWACVEFVNTLSGRGRDRPPELLASYSDLIAWSRARSHLDAREAAYLIELANNEPLAAEGVRTRAVRLRDALHGMFLAVAQGEPPRGTDLEAVNLELVRISPHLCCLRWIDGEARLDWSTALALDRPLWRVLRSAIDLVTSVEGRRVKQCEAEGCCRLFLDETRNHSRRWCDMAVCGNREKARRLRRRRGRRRSASS